MFHNHTLLDATHVPRIVSGAVKQWDAANTSSHVTLSGTPLLTATSITGASPTDGTRGTIFWNSGKHYFEVTATNVAGTGCGPCFISSAFVVGTDTFSATESVMYYSVDGNIYIASGVVGGVVSFTTGDILGMAVDCTNELIWFNKNNGIWGGTTITGDPTDPIGGHGISWSSALSGTGSGYPAVAFFDSGSIMTANFGPSYTYIPPVGYV